MSASQPVRFPEPPPEPGDAADNQYVGRQLLEVEFYRALRVLDGDKFFVRVVF